jgi:hypothetical protein
VRCALPICLRERWRHQPTGWPRSMPLARSRPSAVFAIPVTIVCPDPRRPPSSAPRDLTVSCVAVGWAFALPPLSRGMSQAITARRPYRLGAARFEGSPAPSPVLDQGYGPSQPSWLERSAVRGYSGDTGRNFPCIESFEPMVANCLRGAATGRN